MTNEELRKTKLKLITHPSLSRLWVKWRVARRSLGQLRNSKRSILLNWGSRRKMTAGTMGLWRIPYFESWWWIFLNQRSNLRAKTGTYLEKMFRKGSTTTCSADGSYFIDRDLRACSYVLEYLRNDDMLVKSGDEIVRIQVLDDAEYFQLPKGLQGYLRWSS